VQLWRLDKRSSMILWSSKCSFRLPDQLLFCLLPPAVNMPGYYYVIDSTGTNVTQVICPVNTYSAGFKKQRACVPCPTGFITKGLTGRTKPTDCSECLFT